MIIGQSAGIAAALASRQDSSVQDLPYDVLKDRLLSQGQVLDLPTEEELPPKRVKKGGIDPESLEGIVLDDATAELEGTWKRSTGFGGYIGSGYLHDEAIGDGTSRAKFTFSIPESGSYEVFVAYFPHETRAKAVPLEIIAGENNIRMSIDETIPLPTGKSLRSLGTVELPSAEEATLTITNTNTKGFVILDAVVLRIVKE